MDKIQRIEVTAFIINKNKTLILKRAEHKKVLPGFFELPGGGVEFGEGLEDALKREVKEEIDLEIKVNKLYSSFSSIINNTQYIDIQFYVEIISNLEIRLSPEHVGFKWISENEIDNYKFSPEMKQAIKNGFSQI